MCIDYDRYDRFFRENRSAFDAMIEQAFDLAKVNEAADALTGTTDWREENLGFAIQTLSFEFTFGMADEFGGRFAPHIPRGYIEEFMQRDLDIKESHLGHLIKGSDDFVIAEYNAARRRGTIATIEPITLDRHRETVLELVGA